MSSSDTFLRELRQDPGIFLRKLSQDPGTFSRPLRFRRGKGLTLKFAALWQRNIIEYTAPLQLFAFSLFLSLSLFATKISPHAPPPPWH